MTLKEIRKSKKMTQEEMAALLGCRQTSICGFEKNRKRCSITMKSLRKYAEVLGYTVTIQFEDKVNGNKVNVDGLL